MGAGPATRLEVGIEGLRSTQGTVLVCLTAAPDHFPGCKGDPAARKSTVAAKNGATVAFEGLPSGDYAIALFHDENGNARLDTRMGIPREGYGFSRNATAMFGAPSFAAASLHLAGGEVRERIKLRYLF